MMTQGELISLYGIDDSVFVAASTFAEKGGWISDPQFMEQMGSSYLIAHGLGNPVADAYTKIIIPQTGRYNLFVRTCNWTAPWSDKPAPGVFRVSVDDTEVEALFGTQGGGRMALAAWWLPPYRERRAHPDIA